MKQFIKKTTLFVGVPLVLFTLFIIVLEFANYKKAKTEHLNSSITRIFIGDSHIEQAINDTLLEHSVNIAQSSESFYFSYYKLKHILEQNPSIKDIYLGFSYHSLSSYYDKFIFGEFSNAISSRYFSLLPPNQKIELLNANRNNLFSYLKVVAKNDILNLWKKQNTYKGGFSNIFSNTKANYASIEKRVFFQYYTKDSLTEYSLINIEYLNKIEDLCKQSNVKLTLVNTPVHKLYKNKVPSKFKDKFEELSLSGRFEILDLSDLLSEEDYFIPDGDHVSLKGAIKTTEYLTPNFK